MQELNLRLATPFRNDPTSRRDSRRYRFIKSLTPIFQPPDDLRNVEDHRRTIDGVAHKSRDQKFPSKAKFESPFCEHILHSPCSIAAHITSSLAIININWLS